MEQFQSEQMSLFLTVPPRSDEHVKQSSDTKGHVHQAVTWHLFIDGAARRNPGPAGAGIYILKDGMPFFQDGYYLGELTNNQAEYMSLLVGLYYVEQWKQPEDELSIFSDSQLLVRQIHGIYRVRNEGLLQKHKVALQWVKALHGSIHHIPREENSHADSMANKGIDLKKAVPAQFTTRLRAYEAALR